MVNQHRTPIQQQQCVVGVNFRLNYIYRPGDDLFIVFNEFRDRSQATTDLDRQLIVKFTHSFDF